MHAEQLLFSRRVEATGAGVLLTEMDARTALRKTLQRVLDEPAFRKRARALAESHAASAMRDVAGDVAARCIALAERATFEGTSSR